jgi:hypothetical protein
MSCLSCGRLKNLYASLPKSAFCPRLFQASAAPRPENSNSDEKDALFGLDTQITIIFSLENFVRGFYCAKSDNLGNKFHCKFTGIK